ncbi:ralA-binding protein 1-like [Pollicipes pollicipes]|nr:ralA-binding protein 1-like [Pollicipes pollicipes]
METLYKYRTYSVDSSDDPSGEDSDDSDTEEDLVKQLLEIARHNQQLEAKNAQLVRAIHEERRCCQKRRAQIRYLELQATVGGRGPD